MGHAYSTVILSTDSDLFSRDVFYRMGFNDQEIVILSGAHALGVRPHSSLAIRLNFGELDCGTNADSWRTQRCHSDRSGFEGPWVVSPTRFSNQYFKMLTNFKWEKKEWTGPFQYKNEDLGEELMMLPTGSSSLLLR